MTGLFGILWAASMCLLLVCLLYYLISILKQISVISVLQWLDDHWHGKQLSM